MKCLILCAGYGMRLYPLTENFPKPLLPINKKPIIDYLIDDLEKGGYIDEYIVVSNHKFIDHFNDWQKGRIENITLIDDGSTTNETRLGAVKDIELAIKSLNMNDDLLVLAGDNLLDFSLNEFIKFAKDKNSSAIMTHYERSLPKLQRTGVCTFDDDYLLTSMEEKPINPKSNYAVPPFYIYKKEDLHLIEEGLEAGCGIDAPGDFLQWFVKRATCYAFLMPGKRYDIGTLDDYNSLKDSDISLK